MIFKKRKTNFINIAESGALSDLAFLLIIFFIITAVFSINRGFILGLPQKDSTKIVNVEDIIRITLNEDNKIIYMQNQINLTQLEDIVKERLNFRPNMTFLLKIHPESTYQYVVDIVDKVRNLDVENFSFSLLENEK
ncbi:MAG: biopolymer transporter ExbD [Spirochaetes bacterium]|nr:biopolymer transporter ExbD [Spirochaetota bacterium]